MIGCQTPIALMSDTNRQIGDSTIQVMNSFLASLYASLCTVVTSRFFARPAQPVKGNRRGERLFPIEF